MKKKRVSRVRQKLMDEIQKRGRMTVSEIQEFFGYEKRRTALSLVHDMRKERYGIEIDRKSPAKERAYFYTERPLEVKPMIRQIHEKLACDVPYEWYSRAELKEIFEIDGTRLSRVMSKIKDSIQAVEHVYHGPEIHYRLKGKPYGEKE